jgi:hypothetical protein
VFVTHNLGVVSPIRPAHLRDVRRRHRGAGDDQGIFGNPRHPTPADSCGSRAVAGQEQGGVVTIERMPPNLVAHCPGPARFCLAAVCRRAMSHDPWPILDRVREVHPGALLCDLEEFSRDNLRR